VSGSKDLVQDPREHNVDQDCTCKCNNTYKAHLRKAARTNADGSTLGIGILIP
jgi:hypothetical protein